MPNRIVVAVTMPTFLLVLAVLIGRLSLAIVRGAAAVLVLPLRTALAVAPHLRRPRGVLLVGALASGLLVGAAALVFWRLS